MNENEALDHDVDIENQEEEPGDQQLINGPSVAASDIEEVINRFNQLPLPMKQKIMKEFFIFWNLFKKISKSSLAMGFSYTFSFEVVFVSFLLNVLNPTQQNIAADTLISTMMNTIVALGFSSMFAVGMIASKQYGALKQAEKQNLNASSIAQLHMKLSTLFRNSLLLGSTLAPFVILSFVFSKSLLVHLFHQNLEVAQLTQEFLEAYSPAALAMIFRISAEQFLFVFGHKTAAMGIGLGSFIIAALLAMWVGFGGWGLEAQGAVGVARVFVLEAFSTALLFTLYLGLHKNFREFSFFKVFQHLKGNLQQLKELLKLGSSISFFMLAELALPLVTSLFAGLLGTQAQSAWNFAMQLVFFMLIISLCFGQGCSQKLNQYLGARRYQDAYQAGKYGLITTLIWSTPLPLGIAIFPKSLTVFLGKDVDHINPILSYLMPLVAGGVIAESARNNLLQQARAYGDANGGGFVSMMGLILGMVLAALLGLGTDLGIYGIALGYTLGITIAASFLFTRWLPRIQPQAMKQQHENPAPSYSMTHRFCNFFRGEQRVLRGDQELTEKTPLFRGLGFSPT